MPLLSAFITVREIPAFSITLLTPMHTAAPATCPHGLPRSISSPFTYDILIVQSAGNLPTQGISPYLGIKDHLDAGRQYPAYLYEPSARIANPAQSLQALTVGSIAYGAFNAGDWRIIRARQ